MRPIKFDELYWKNNPVYSFLAALCAVFLVLSLFDVFSSYLDDKTIKFITACCYILITWNGFKLFWYRNYVQWNKRGINIRVNEFWGKNFAFSDIRKVVYAEDEYTIITDFDRRKTINLEGIEQESKEQLLRILRTNVK